MHEVAKGHHAFLSYARADEAWATRVHSALERAGLRVFLDLFDIAPGESFPRRLADAVAESEWCLVLVSPAWIDGRWGRWELSTHLAHRLDRVLPLCLVPPEEQPAELRAAQGVDLTDESRFDEQIEVLAATLRGQGRGEVARIRRAWARKRNEPVDAGWEVPAHHREALQAWLTWVAGTFDDLPLVAGASRFRLSDQYVRLEQRKLGGGPPMRLDDVLAAGNARWATGPGNTLIPVGAGRWTLQGDPGSGKTTLLRHLALEQARVAEREVREEGTLRAGALPIFLPLAALGAGGRLHEVAAGQVTSLRPSPHLPEALLWAIEGGRALLLLDGLDEVSPEDVEDAVKQVAALAEYQKTPILMTSRRFGYRHPHAAFTELELLPLDIDAQRQLLGAWLSPAQVAEVQGEIAASAALQDMAGTPFVLTLLALLKRDAPDEALPRRRFALYDRIVALFLTGNLWDSKANPGRRRVDLPPADLRRRLADLALALLQTHAGPWSPAEVAAALDPAVQIDALAAHTGLLLPAEGKWRFLHRSLLEFLAAEALSARDPFRFARTLAGRTPWYRFWTAGDPEQLGRWSEVYGYLAHAEADQTRFLKRIKQLHPKLALRVMLDLDELPPDRLCAELGVASDDPLPLVRALMERLNDDREALVRRLVALARQQRDRPEALQYIAAALVALDAVGAPLAIVRKLAGADIGVPEQVWAHIPAGTFLMGSPEGEGDGDEHPQRPVTLRPFDMLTAPVTQGLYAVVTGTNPSHFRDDLRRPVETVSWKDAVDFCNALSRSEGLPPAYDGQSDLVPNTNGYRLPTEAQWEYACRAGNPGRWCFGDDKRKLSEYAWFGEGSSGTIHPVAQKKANAFGLFDMHGNVWEWCYDWLGTYPGVPQTEPLGDLRVVRGGSYWNGAGMCRSAFRGGFPPGYRSRYLGFRLVRPAPPGR